MPSFVFVLRRKNIGQRINSASLYQLSYTQTKQIGTGGEIRTQRPHAPKACALPG